MKETIIRELKIAAQYFAFLCLAFVISFWATLASIMAPHPGDSVNILAVWNTFAYFSYRILLWFAIFSMAIVGLKSWYRHKAIR